MSSVKTLNANAEVMNRAAALFMNINAAKGLMDVMRSNYGPKGTIKMLVSGAGDIKLTKDGNVLLREVSVLARGPGAPGGCAGPGTVMWWLRPCLQDLGIRATYSEGCLAGVYALCGAGAVMRARVAGGPRAPTREALTTGYHA